ncbi:tRNA lysidine(34) synthetase TilS [Candidatus Saccharibacteria bacterium]|nr:tRNA lysidine(34) synthetase TilS [Candidatus Saccharibacteria bacterium]
MMEITIESGKYVIAVSGGIDSMVLLDLLSGQSDLRLVVAHYDHGIRTDSPLDRQLVQEVARKSGLVFVYDEGHLGSGTSEAVARKARYDFLHQTRKASGARAIITAHHKDDMLETAILNIIRGTGRKGLSSLKSTDVIVRPLLHLSKQQLKDYANTQGLKWHEDSTNEDTRYFRNYVRHRVLDKFSAKDKDDLSGLIGRVGELNEEIDYLLMNHLHMQPALDKLDRYWFTMLPHQVAREVMATWLRRHNVKDISTKMLDRLIVAAKTLQIDQKTDVDATHVLSIQKATIALLPRER